MEKETVFAYIRLAVYVVSFGLGIVFGYWQAVAYVTVLSIIALLEGAWTDRVTAKTNAKTLQTILDAIADLKKDNGPE